MAVPAVMAMMIVITEIMKLQRNLNVRKSRGDFVLIIKSGKKNMIGLLIAPVTRRKQNVKYVLKRLVWRMTVLIPLNLVRSKKHAWAVCARAGKT